MRKRCAHIWRRTFRENSSVRLLSVDGRRPHKLRAALESRTEAKLRSFSSHGTSSILLYAFSALRGSFFPAFDSSGAAFGAGKLCGVASSVHPESTKVSFHVLKQRRSFYSAPNFIFFFNYRRCVLRGVRRHFPEL